MADRGMNVAPTDLIDDGLEIETLGIDDIRPNPRNARTHSDEQVAQIAASIEEFGYNAPILIDGANEIIVGEGRWRACKSLGMTTVQVVRREHMTEAQKRAYLLADNRIAQNAGWDIGLLKAELADLRAMGADLTVIGFDPSELEAFTGYSEASPPEDFKAYDETIPVEHECPKCGYRFSGGKVADAE